MSWLFWVLERGPTTATLELAVQSLFSGHRSRYLKMEQILLPQRHRILPPQRSSKEVTTTHLNCLPPSRSVQGFSLCHGAILRLFCHYHIPLLELPHPPQPTMMFCASAHLCEHTCYFCLLFTEATDATAKGSKLVSELRAGCRGSNRMGDEEEREEGDPTLGREEQ